MLGVAHVLGLMLAVFGATYMLPVLTALIMGDGQALHFVACGGDQRRRRPGDRRRHAA